MTDFVVFSLLLAKRKKERKKQLRSHPSIAVVIGNVSPVISVKTV